MTDTFGIFYKLTDKGGTHDPFLEGVIEGCAKGTFIDLDFIQNEMARRAPNRNPQSTQRREKDPVIFLLFHIFKCQISA